MKQMALGIYSIFDLKSLQYDNPFFAHSDLMAKRRYMLMADEKGSPLSKWPDDFELHRLSEFDIITGTITPTKKPELIFQGKDLPK